MKKYDLIFVMELVDSTEELVLSGFVQQLNNQKQSSSSLNSYHRSVENQGFMFDYVVSERVGRTNYKEQYATIFRFLKMTCTLVGRYNVFLLPSLFAELMLFE